MKVSYNWLKDYVSFSLSPNELAEKLTHIGLVVADIQQEEDDYCLDIEVTANRSDCLGMIGVAREIAAMSGKEIRLPETNHIRTDNENSSVKPVQVSVEDPTLCPCYTAQVIRNITIEPSPEWMQKRLNCIGLKPVNNIVDITNYIMMETGQPLHAFDFDKLTGERITVRRAESGEEIVAINGARRVLFHDMLVIADEKKPVAIAGIMGGEDTEVTDSTQNILLECAHFEPRQVRRTSKALGITSDSSYRFERGTDPLSIQNASGRAIQYIKEYAWGKVYGDRIQAGAFNFEAKRVTLRIDRLQTLLGVEIKRDTILDILKRLQFNIVNYVDTFIDVEVPGFRNDVSREVDLIEEVSRIYGYDNIPTKIAIHIRGNTRSKYEMVEDAIRQYLTGLGFFEVKTFSIVDVSPLQSVNLWSDSGGVDIANPLRQDQSRLRTSLLPGMLLAKRHNINHGIERVKFFEIAKVYLKKNKLPQEKNCVSVLDSSDFMTMKGVVESLLVYLGIQEKSDWEQYSEPKLFKHDRGARIRLSGKTVGFIGEANEDFGFKSICTLLEMDMDALIEKAIFLKVYKQPVPYPVVWRDMAIVLDETTQWASVERSIQSLQIPILKEIHFFDIYRGTQIPAGKKSIAFKLCFQSDERTLKSEEVDLTLQIMLDALQKNLSAELRKQ